MKNKVIMSNIVALLIASTTFGQGVENDDMYFTSKDRAKLKAQKASEDAAYTASVKKSKKNQSVEEELTNPTDSYSARNVNPEFAARSNSQVAKADNEDYFVNNYQYNNASDLNKWNNNFNSWYSNPWYSANYFGPSINSWNSPYYGSYYDSWGNPWSNPYYRSGWSSSFSYYHGSSWNYGWGGAMGMGMSYGYGNPYMNSWSSWGPSYGYSSGYNSYYNPTVVIINNGEGGRNVAYGKRATHGGAVITRQEEIQSRTRSNYVPATTDGGRPNSGGRVATQTSQRQEDYYNRSYRNSQQSNTGTTSPSRSSGWSGNSGSSNNGSFNNQGSSSNTSSPSRSSTYDGGGATRSSAPASSGSNGRTRGRD